MPGNLLLGARYLNNYDYELFAQELLDSCYKTWANSPTGLSPEAWGWIDESTASNFSSKQYSKAQVSTFQRIGFIPTDNHYLLRPGKLIM
jgi:mannosyl-oligosaccharide alpha-1,2-mannosidase